MFTCTYRRYSVGRGGGVRGGGIVGIVVINIAFPFGNLELKLFDYDYRQMIGIV
jgi:hypothetical protein